MADKPAMPRGSSVKPISSPASSSPGSSKIKSSSDKNRKAANITTPLEPVEMEMDIEHSRSIKRARSRSISTSEHDSNKRKAADTPVPPLPAKASSFGDVSDSFTIPVPEKIIQLTKNRYKAESLGPFTVYIDCFAQPSPSSNNLNTSSLKLIKNTYSFAAEHLSNASDLRKIGRNRFSVNFFYYNLANEFVKLVWLNSSKILENNIIIAYIPSFKVFKQILLRGIDDPDLDCKLIRSNLKPYPQYASYWHQPVKIEKLKKRFTDPSTGNVSLQDTNMFIALFNFTDIPDRALLLGRNVFLSPFIQQVRRCTACQRFGHTRRLCKTSVDKCVCERCGQLGHLGSTCDSTVFRCINCVRDSRTLTDHRASDGDCPVFKYHRELKRIMAFLAISMHDAKVYFETKGPLPSVSSHSLPPLALHDFLPFNSSKPLYSDAVKQPPILTSMGGGRVMPEKSAPSSIRPPGRFPPHFSSPSLISSPSSIPMHKKAVPSRIPVTDHLIGKMKLKDADSYPCTPPVNSSKPSILPVSTRPLISHSSMESPFSKSVNLLPPGINALTSSFKSYLALKLFNNSDLNLLQPDDCITLNTIADELVLITTKSIVS